MQATCEPLARAFLEKGRHGRLVPAGHGAPRAALTALTALTARAQAQWARAQCARAAQRLQRLLTRSELRGAFACREGPVAQAGGAPVAVLPGKQGFLLAKPVRIRAFQTGCVGVCKD